MEDIIDPSVNGDLDLIAELEGSAASFARKRNYLEMEQQGYRPAGDLE